MELDGVTTYLVGFSFSGVIWRENLFKHPHRKVISIQRISQQHGTQSHHVCYQEMISLTLLLYRYMQIFIVNSDLIYKIS